MTVYTPDDRGNARPSSDRDRERMSKQDDNRPVTDEPTPAESARPSQKKTMGGVSHTNPVTGEPFGKSQVYGRGRTVVADGGKADAADEDDDEERVATVKDVDHTPREGAPDASGVYERGGEGKLDEDADEEETENEAENETEDVEEASGE